MHKLQYFRKELVFADCLPRLQPEFKAPAKDKKAAASNSGANDTESSTTTAPALSAAASITETRLLDSTVDTTASASVLEATVSLSKEGVFTAGQGPQKHSHQPTIPQSYAKGGLSKPKIPGMLDLYLHSNSHMRQHL